MAKKSLTGFNAQDQKIVQVAPGTDPTDAVNKSQLDASGSNLDWKENVRVATTANGALATAYANGQTVNGVVLATGDRILLKDQTAGAENGIYTVNASGAPTRATDADTAAKIKGAITRAAEGDVKPNTMWQLITDTITLDTTALVWTEYSTGGGTYSADGEGITESGGVFSLELDGASLEKGPGGLKVADGYATRKYAEDVGAMTGGTPYDVVHNLGTLDVVVQVVIKGTGEVVDLDVVVDDVNTVTLTSAAAQTAAFLRVTVIG